MTWLILLVPVFIALMFLIAWLEKRYYERHPEKEWPKPDLWP